MKTYWLVLNHKRSDVASSTGHSGNSDSAFDPSEPEELETMDLDPRAFRLVNWNVEILLRLLKHVVVRRLQCTKGIQQKAAEWYSSCKSAKTVIDEVAEIITLPSFASPTDSLDIEAVVLDDATIDQLREYVNEIASLYNNNPFHNFDHASHVVMVSDNRYCFVNNGTARSF